MNKPLVSIVVITYNSSKTVLETLDSIAAQTYKNIELIVSDDCSKDDTVKVVKAWLDEHNGLFVRNSIITIGTNTGTVKNLNRGIKDSKGEWIKMIAGDDCLCEDAIEKYVNYIKSHSECKMCVAQVELFSSDGNVDKRHYDAYDTFFKKINVSQREQWKNIKYEMTFVGPTYFFSRELYDEVSGFDEKYVLVEEWPFCYNVLNKGYKIYAINEKLVKYRISSNSVCHSIDHGLRGYQLYKDSRNFYVNVCMPALIKEGRLICAWDYYIIYVKEGLLQDHKESRFWYLMSKSLSLINLAWYKKKIISLLN